MTTRQNAFTSGSLHWHTGSMTAAELVQRYLDRDWQDGFAAFSNAERRLGEIGGTAHFTKLLDGRIEQQDGIEGYLMEGGLWRHDPAGQIFEELCLEREGGKFFVQYWQLCLSERAEDGASPCYWRPAATFARGNLRSLFPEQIITTFEVIVPTDRLRFYITRGQ